MLANFLTKRLAPRVTFRGLHATAFNLEGYPYGKTGRPLSAYIRFVQEKRAEVLAKEPSLTVPQVGVRMGELWRALPESTRKQLTDEYFAEVARAKTGKH